MNLRETLLARKTEYDVIEVLTSKGGKTEIGVRWPTLALQKRLMQQRGAGKEIDPVKGLDQVITAVIYSACDVESGALLFDEKDRELLANMPSQWQVQVFQKVVALINDTRPEVAEKNSEATPSEQTS
jgi:hypothetical protein